jgi:hypothetical protein
VWLYKKIASFLKRCIMKYLEVGNNVWISFKIFQKTTTKRQSKCAKVLMVRVEDRYVGVFTLFSPLLL